MYPLGLLMSDTQVIVSEDSPASVVIEEPQAAQVITVAGGPKGDKGAAATIAIGTVSQGSSPQVTNSGTPTAAILDFVLQKGDKGDKGDTGATGPSVVPIGLPGVKGQRIQAAKSGSISITFDQALLTNTVGNALFFRNGSLTANLLSSGAGGLDTGTSTSGTFYSLWLISNGTLLSALLSLSANSPTLPTGYTYAVRIGWVCTNLSTSPIQLLSTIQQGSVCTFIGDATDPEWLNSATSEGMTSITAALSQHSLKIPSTAKSVNLQVNATTSAATFVIMQWAYSATGALHNTFWDVEHNATVAFYLEIPIVASSIYVLGRCTAGSVLVSLGVRGWDDNL